MKNIITCLIAVLLFASCEKSKLNSKISYDSGWNFYSESSSSDTISLNLPMTFLDTWYKNQIVEDLHYSDNAAAIFLDFEKKWVLERQIHITEEELSYSSILMHLGNLDGKVDIIINGTLLDSARGDEKGEDFELKDKIVIGENTLQLIYEPLFTEGKVKGQDYYSKNQFRKGNDFSPAHRNAGLENVSLHFNNQLFLKGHFLQSISERLDEPSFQLIVDIHNVNYKAREIKLEIPALDLSLIVEKEALDSSGYVSFAFPVSKEDLWFPNSLGEAKMFDASLSLVGNHGLIEEKEIKLGFNVHQWRKVNQAYSYYINDKNCQVRAIELSPSSLYHPEGTKSYWRKQLVGLIDLGINCIKLNSDNFYAPKTLLELCDSIGILVWQDFNFERPGLDSDPIAQLKVRENIVQAILNYREHPSVMAVGVGNIEKKNISKLTNLSGEEKKTVLKKDIELFEYLAPKLAKSGSGIRFFPNSESFWNFDEEVRTPSMPNYGYLDLWLSENEKDPEDKSWQIHSSDDLDLKEYYEKIISDFTDPLDLEALIYFSELYQDKKLLAYLKKKGKEKLLLLPLTYNEMWPSISPTVQTYFGSKKAVYYSLKRSIQDYSFELDRVKPELSVSMTNNSSNVVNGTIEIELYHLNGNQLEIEKFPIQLSSGNKGQVFFKDYTEDLADKIVKVKYMKGDSLIYSETFDFISYSMPKLPLPTPAYRVVTEGNLSYLELFSESYMKTVKLSANHLGFFEENYFNLLPGDTLRIPFISEDLVYPLTVEEVSVYSYYQTYE